MNTLDRPETVLDAIDAGAAFDDAVAAGDAGRAMRVLEAAADAPFATAAHDAALWWAAKSRSPFATDIVNHLLVWERSGISGGGGLVHAAIAAGCDRNACALIADGRFPVNTAPPRSAGAWKENDLVAAIAAGLPGTVDLLLGPAGVPVDGLTEPLALVMAIDGGYPEILRALLACGRIDPSCAGHVGIRRVAQSRSNVALEILQADPRTSVRDAIAAIEGILDSGRGGLLRENRGVFVPFGNAFDHVQSLRWLRSRE